MQKIVSNSSNVPTRQQITSYQPEGKFKRVCTIISCANDMFERAKNAEPERKNYLEQLWAKVIGQKTINTLYKTNPEDKTLRRFAFKKLAPVLAGSPDEITAREGVIRLFERIAAKLPKK